MGKIYGIIQELLKNPITYKQCLCIYCVFMYPLVSYTHHRLWPLLIVGASASPVVPMRVDPGPLLASRQGECGVDAVHSAFSPLYSGWQMSVPRPLMWGSPCRRHPLIISGSAAAEFACASSLDMRTCRNVSWFAAEMTVAGASAFQDTEGATRGPCSGGVSTCIHSPNCLLRQVSITGCLWV